MPVLYSECPAQVFLGFCPDFGLGAAEHHDNHGLAIDGTAGDEATPGSVGVTGLHAIHPSVFVEQLVGVVHGAGIPVCQGEIAKNVAKCTTTMGMNKFVPNAPVLIVISDEPYNKTAAFGAKVKKLDYRSMDIGIATAYLTSEATAQGIESCIIGWLNDKKIQNICNLQYPVRLVIALGYAKADYKLRAKKRKSINEIATFLK